MRRKFYFLAALLLCGAYNLSAQTMVWVSSSETQQWQEKKVKLSSRVAQSPCLMVDAHDAALATFDVFGTCFNERGWDALMLLSAEDRDKVVTALFAPSGDLRFGEGRIPMNASDYARDWYSCDEVSGDFDLAYFNIERDKSTLIPYIHLAQAKNPAMTFWLSPWSPPSWMKINHDYPVRSSEQYNNMDAREDIALFRGTTDVDNSVWPPQLAVQDYFIQDPRYLQAYANYFCRFIRAYKDEGIDIGRVMFQNELWSYTVYPGCAWTIEGTLRFNTEYLAPTLQKECPATELYFGTINTNRLDFIEQIMDDERMQKVIKGLGFQWEGCQIISQLKAKYPNYRYVQTESECGSGTFDWPAAEHTFDLINQYLALGCEEYTFWNCILADRGESGWGWCQNALIRVDSASKTAIFTPEFFAAKHYCRYIVPGSRLLGAKEGGEDKMSVVVYLTPKEEYVVVAGNFADEQQTMCVEVGGRYLSVVLPAHTMHTFVGK